MEIGKPKRVHEIEHPTVPDSPADLPKEQPVTEPEPAPIQPEKEPVAP